MAELPVPATSADDVRRATESVLSRPEFAEAQPSLWDRLWTMLGDAIARVLETLSGGGRGSVIGTVALVVVAAVLAFAVVRLTRSVRKDPGVEFTVEGHLGRTSAEWSAEADDHERAGQWRDAVRCRYRAVLADLAAAGLVDEVSGRTSGEYLAAVRRDAPAADASFTEVTRRFESAWYGHGTTTAADHAEVVDAAGRSLADAGIRRVVGARR